MTVACGQRTLRNGVVWDDPSGLETGHGGDVVKVGVVMQHDGAVLFGDGGGEDVRTASGAVLTAPGEHGLNLAGATGDLRRERQIHESGRAQGTRCASSGTFASTHAHSIAEIARLRCRTDLKPCAERDFEKLSRVWTGPRGC